MRMRKCDRLERLQGEKKTKLSQTMEKFEQYIIDHTNKRADSHRRTQILAQETTVVQDQMVDVQEQIEDLMRRQLLYKEEIKSYDVAGDFMQAVLAATDFESAEDVYKRHETLTASIEVLQDRFRKAYDELQTLSMVARREEERATTQIMANTRRVGEKITQKD